MIVTTVCKLLFALAIGYFLNKKGILDAVTNKKISYIIMQIAFPLMIVSSVSNAQSGDKAEVFKLLIAGFVMYIIMPFVAIILSKLMFVSKDEESVYQAMYIFPNFLFMGYPVASALYGDECIFYISIFHMLFNTFYYSYGIHLITKSGNVQKSKMSIRQILNNGIIASIVALVLFFFSIPLPSGVTEVISFIGDISTPVSMLIIGATIGGYELKAVFDNKRLFIVTAIRLILFPIITYYLMTLAGFDGEIRGVATITVGMPIASAVSMTSIEYGCNEKLASMSVVVTTLCSIITIPIMLYILE